MGLKSQLMAGDERLEGCLVRDDKHLTLGVKGEFVAKVQAALIFLDDLSIDEGEQKTSTYGDSTAAAVLAFKKKRKIINHSYQSAEDNIVGKMTIKALDEEMAKAESTPADLTFSLVCIEKLEG